MLEHFKAINVQESKNCGASPAGALSILGPVIQSKAWVPMSATAALGPSLHDYPLYLPCKRHGQSTHLGSQ
jgi:hypothetical protein